MSERSSRSRCTARPMALQQRELRHRILLHEPRAQGQGTSVVAITAAGIPVTTTGVMQAAAPQDLRAAAEVTTARAIRPCKLLRRPRPFPRRPPRWDR